jgi:hypothetical protein
MRCRTFGGVEATIYVMEGGDSVLVVRPVALHLQIAVALVCNVHCPGPCLVVDTGRVAVSQTVILM